MSRFPTITAMFLGGVLALLVMPPTAAAKKKATPAPAGKGATAAADGDSAGKKTSGPPLDLPLPAKVPGTVGSSPTENKSAEGAASSVQPAAKPAPNATTKREHGANATIEPDSIAEFATQSPRIQQLVRDAIDLTRLNLTYTSGSADPDNGGMDGSGAIYYLLHAHRFNDMARDAGGQYLWARKSGNFFPVVSKSEDSVEFNEMIPGDLMFWTGALEPGQDVPISHVMLYLGREKETGKRIMFGASEGGSYHDIPRRGVSIFDLKMPKSDPANPEKAPADFIGFAHLPSLHGGIPAVAQIVVAAAKSHDAGHPGSKSKATSSKKKKRTSRNTD